MIIKSNNKVFKNYFGNENVNKIYAGENLVFGHDEPTEIKNYLALTAIEDASVGLTSSKDGGVDIKYSSDGKNWTQWDYANETLNLPAGETLYFKGDNSRGFSGQESTTFQLNNGKVSGHGNIQSLVYDDNFADNNDIPSAYCYRSMFQNCTALTTAPELPATALASDCYEQMFYGCTSLTTAPELPATRLTSQCYRQMFYGCTSLTTAPELPATTLTLASGCYHQMFRDCTNLNYIKAMFTTAPSMSYTNTWVKNVSSTGTFVMNAAAEWDPEDYRSSNGIPAGWSVIKE